VILDIAELPLHQNLTLRYDFYDRQIVTEPEDFFCNLPYFTQELQIVSQASLDRMTAPANYADI
jgi:hypothetical protein